MEGSFNNDRHHELKSKGPFAHHCLVVEKQWRSKKEVCLCRQLSKDKITKHQEYTRESEKLKLKNKNKKTGNEQKLKGGERQILKISGENLGKIKTKLQKQKLNNKKQILKIPGGRLVAASWVSWSANWHSWVDNNYFNIIINCFHHLYHPIHNKYHRTLFLGWQ